MGKFTLNPVPLIEGLPLKIGALTLRDAQPEVITAISPFKGKEAAMAKALGAWVAPGQSAQTKHGRLIWSGLNQAFLFGRVETANAACVDISDGWVFFALEGEGAYHVLERLVPIDLRHAAVGSVFRTQLSHLMAIIIVTSDGFEIGVMSSLAQSAKHEIESVMESLTESVR